MKTPHYISTIICAIILCFSFSSCKKDFNCVCRYDIAGVDQVDTYDINDVKRSTAKDECDEHEDEKQILFPDASCDIE